MKSIFKIFQKGLKKTKTSLVRKIQGIFTNVTTWNEETYNDLEAALIATDLGVQISTQLVENIKDRYQQGLIETTEDVMKVAEEEVIKILDKDQIPQIQLAPTGPTIILMVGVNGSGKTTTTAKLAHLYQKEGKKVMLAACDTFRAAGATQLQIWAERIGCSIVAGKQHSDAAAVAFDAVNSAISKKMDILIIDTAGRQHTKIGLMNELGKMKRTINKALPNAPHEVFLTVDASIGTNALIQAREFGKLCEVSGLLLTKLDGTGKGGVVVAIRHELGYPVRFVGFGEELDDLQPFDNHIFAKALFE